MARLVTIRRGRKGSKTSLSPFYSLPRDTTKSILVSRKLGGVGDVIMTLPAIRGLREKYPKAHITYAVCNKWGSIPDVLLKLVAGNPYPNEIVGITPHQYPELAELEKAHDFYIDITGQELSHEYKGKAEHRIDLFCSRLRVAPRSKVPELFLTREEKEFGEHFIQTNCPGVKPIALQPTCYGHIRNWGYNKFVQLAKRITRELDRQVIIFSDSDSAAMHFPGVINRTGNPLRMDAAILEHCSMMIGADSGLLHLAGACKTPILGLFGSVPPMARLGYYIDASWIWHSEMPCIGCYYKHNCPPHDQNDPKPCMQRITVDEVMTNIRAKLARYQTRSRVLAPAPPVTDIKKTPSTNPKVLVGVLTFDLVQKTRRTINSITTKTDYDVLVVDNFSTDNTFNYLIKSNINFIRKETSISGAINICMQEAMARGYDYLLMCNNDIVLGDYYIDTLVKEYESIQGCGFITGITLNVDGEARKKLEKIVQQRNTVPMGKVFYTGEFSAFLVGRKTIETVGLFDTTFSPRYIEDDDYKHRIELAGLKMYRTGKTTFLHDCGATIKEVVPNKPAKWRHDFVGNIRKYIEKWGAGPPTLPNHYEGQKLMREGVQANGGIFEHPYDNPDDSRILKTIYQNNRSPRRVIMVQPERMGDIVMALPVMYDLKKYHPDCHVTWACDPKYHSLFESVPYVDEVINCTLDEAEGLVNRVKGTALYDRVYVANIAKFSCQIYENTNIDFASCIQRTAGNGTLDHRTPVFVPSEPIITHVEDLLRPLKGKDLIALSLHAYSQKPVLKYAVIDEGLKTARKRMPNVAYIYLGSGAENYGGRYPAIMKAPTANLGIIPEILRRCKGLISVNSGNLCIGLGQPITMMNISATTAVIPEHRKIPLYLKKSGLGYMGFHKRNYTDIDDVSLRSTDISNFIIKAVGDGK